MNAVKDNIITIDGAKLKTLLESATGKTLREISLENGFSDSFLRMVVKTNKATPTAQAVIKLYGIEPSAYEVKPVTSETEPTTSDTKQLTIDDILAPDVKEILRQFIKEAVNEAVNNVKADVDMKRGVIRIYTKEPFTIREGRFIPNEIEPENIKAKHAGEVKDANDKWAI